MIDRRRAVLAASAAGLRPQTLFTLLGHRRRTLTGLEARLIPGLLRSISLNRNAYGQLTDRYSVIPMQRDLERKKTTVEGLSTGLLRAGRARLEIFQQRLHSAERLHQTLSYKATLERGYAVVRSEGDVVTRKTQVDDPSELEIEFADGRLKIGGTGRKARKKAPQEPPEQGTLL
jgi:exodeoxyribonuclease VII large subunit